MLIDITYPLTNWGWTSSSCSTKWLFMSSDGSGSRRLATSIRIQTFELHSTWVFTGKLSLALLNRSKACNHYVLLSLPMVNLTNWQQVEPRAHRQVVSWESLENFDDISVVYKTGLLIFHGKKAKFRGIFRGKFAEKSPISRDFCGKKVKICGKIGRFRGIFAGEKSKFAEKSAHFAGV